MPTYIGISYHNYTVNGRFILTIMYPIVILWLDASISNTLHRPIQRTLSSVDRDL